jgi:hypothetical protein
MYAPAVADSERTDGSRLGKRGMLLGGKNFFINRQFETQRL